MAAVIPLVVNHGGKSDPAGGEIYQSDLPSAKVLSLRSRLFERACEQEWTRRLAALEAEGAIAQQRCGSGPG